MAQQAHRHHAPAEGEGQAGENQGLPQQAAGTPEGAQDHQDRRRHPAQGPGQKAHPRQEDGAGIQSSQHGAQGEPAPAQGFSGHLGAGQEQQIVHKGIEQEQGVYVNDSHGGPSRWVLL